MKLNGHRQVQGILRGFDPFMNLVLDEAVEFATPGQHNNIGMVVRINQFLPKCHSEIPPFRKHFSLEGRDKKYINRSVVFLKREVPF